ncbi:chemotaxis protein CheW [Sorangium sp. So ce136]|uniref:chemotaxis protein CheW n=1 Tax=Sorangium sp. So ce136 TaxID=3133284 RepID=UPI003F0A269D
MPLTGERSRPDPQKSLVGFVVGDVQYAIDITRVREIVNPLEVTTLPHTPPEVSGVANHRGEVVPVIELRVRFGLPPVEPSRSTKWILVDVGTHTVGLVVDAVTEVFGTNGDYRPTPPVGGSSDLRGIVGVTTHDERMIFVLDVGRFIELALALAASGALLEAP